MEIGSPGTFDEMVANHEALDGYQRVADLREWTRKYTREAYKILQDDINKAQGFGGISSEIVQAIDGDARKLAKNTELWRSLRPPKHPKGDATMRYQELLNKRVGEIIDGGGVPFSTSADPLLSASEFGKYTGADGEERLGIIIKMQAPKGTPVVITNPEQAEYIIGSGHALRIDRVGRNVRVHMQHFRNQDGTPGRVEELVADRIIHATIIEVPKPNLQVMQ